MGVTIDRRSATSAVDEWGHEGDDTLFGSAFDDTLAGAQGDDEIHGGAGDDMIRDYTGVIYFPAPSAFEAFSIVMDYDRAPDLVSMSSSMEDIEIAENRYEIFTQLADGPMSGLFHDGNDEYFGDAGDDVIIATVGNDLLDGGADDDRLWGGSGADEIFGGSGNDNLYGNSGVDFLSGGSGDDVLHGGSAADVLVGGAGADLLIGGTGSDTASYETSLGVSIDMTRTTQIGGDAAGDKFVSIENVSGSFFSDTLRGDDAVNTLSGDSGGDTLEGRGGADTLDGGAGVDTASYESSDARVDIDLIRATQIGGDAAGDILIAVENILGSRFDDTLRGNDESFGNRIDGAGGNDLIEGRDGADTLLGGAGEDTLRGGDHNDRLFGGAGEDVIDGDDGIDTADFSDLNLAVDVRLGEAGVDGTATSNEIVFSNGQLSTRPVVDTLRDIENATGTNASDTFRGNSGDNRFEGRDGFDTFFADAGRDTYVGGPDVDTVDYSASAAGVTVSLSFGVRGVGGLAEGDLFDGVEDVIGTATVDRITGSNFDNTLQGRGGDDFLFGSGGLDTLVGGAGFDTLSGGSGADLFRYTSRTDAVFTDATFKVGLIDRIADFAVGQDRIDLSTIDGNASLAGNQAFVFNAGGGFTGGGQASLAPFADGGRVFLFIDFNGDAQLDGMIEVTFAAGAALAASDFVL